MSLLDLLAQQDGVNNNDNIYIELHNFMTQETKDSKPWYKQFWPWFLIALPASSVIAGVTTLIIAINNADSVVKKDYYKDGLAINQTLEKRQQAADLRIKVDALIENHQAASLLIVKVTAKDKIAVPLSMEFRHATLESKDFVLNLQQRANGDYFAPLPEDTHGKWQVTLAPTYQPMTTQPNMASWELQGAWILPSSKPLTLGY